MRRTLLLLASLLLTLSLAPRAEAVNQASQMRVNAVVAAGGECQITLSATVHLDESVDSLRFPLPREATRISLNGSWARTEITETVKYVDLTKAMSGFGGDISFTITYNLPNLVTETPAGLLELRVPLLSGFAFPTASLEAAVTLPGNVEAKPAFSSGYHQAGIEQDLSYVEDGAVITVRSQKTLKDHETLEMTLPVTEEMFPQRAGKAPGLEEMYPVMGGVAVFALLFWFVFLRCAPAWGRRQPQPPEGRTAGELLSILSLQGADLTMMVFSWAQLGYVILEQDRRGRVLIHRQMEMGNERSAFERRCFKLLFGARGTVDTSGLRYGALWTRIHKMSPDIGCFVRSGMGSRKLFRYLSASVGFCAAVSLGILLGEDALLQWPLAIAMGVGGFAISYAVQNWLNGLFSYDRSKLLLHLGLSLLWLIPGIGAKQPVLGLTGMLSGIVSGIFLFIGSRRTPAGRQAMNEVMGLYRYLFHAPTQTLHRISKTNPEYFFDLAPYALGMGVDLRFARHFGKLRMPSCPYIRTASDQNLTAAQWSRTLRQMAAAMDSRRRHAFGEQLFRTLQGGRR